MSWRDLLRPGLDALEPYRVARPEGLVSLDANECPSEAPEALRTRVARIAHDLALNRYPPASAPALREALARRHGVDPEQIVVGNGSDEVIAMLLGAFARPRAGQDAPRAAYPVPTFTMYGIHARVSGFETAALPTGPRFELDPDRVLERLTELRPNLFFLARPNNPTGTLWPRELVERAADLGDVLVVVDEAYGDFSGETLAPLVRDHPTVVVLRTLSKVGYAALRVGWCIAAPEVARELDKVRMPYNLDAFTQAVAREVVTGWDAWVAPNVAAVVRERERLAEALAGRVEVFPSRANLLLVRVPDATRVHRELMARGVLVRNLHGAGTPLENCLRVTVGTPEEDDRFLAALDAVLGESP